MEAVGRMTYKEVEGNDEQIKTVVGFVLLNDATHVHLAHKYDPTLDEYDGVKIYEKTSLYGTALEILT